MTDSTPVTRNSTRSTRSKNSIAVTLLLLFVIALCIVYMFPFYIMIMNTLKTGKEVAMNPIALPSHLYLDNYINAFKKMNLLVSFKNSFLITFSSVTIIVLFGAMAAYPVARLQNKWTNLVLIYFLLGFMVPIQTTIVPLFLVMQKLSLINSLPGMILIYSANCVFSFFMYQAFIRSVPKELEEAAFIDGYSLWGTFWKIVFPLLKPITVTIIIFETMWIWNDFMFAYLFLHSKNKTTLVLEIFKGVGEFANDWSLMLSIMVIVLIPVVVFYVFMQKHIIAGLTSGALKG